MVVASTAASIVLAVLFALTASAKWANLRWFAGVVKSFELLPSPWFTPAAFLVVLAETAVPLLILIGRAQAGATVAAVTLASFTLAVSINLMRGRHPGCGCSGHDVTQQISSLTIWRNVGLLGLAVVGSGILTSEPLVWSVLGASVVMSVAATIAPRMRRGGAVAAVAG